MSDPKNFGDLIAQLFAVYWWMLFFIIPSILAGARELFSAVVYRIANGGGGDSPLLTGKVRRSIAAHELHAAHGDRLLQDVLDIDADPEAAHLTLPTDLRRKIAQHMEDDEN